MHHPPAPCALCQRHKPLTAHHLIPKTLHSNKWFRKNFSKEERLRVIWICRDCHSAIHRFLDEKLLGREFNSLEKLGAHDKLAAFIVWVRGQK